MKKKSQQSVGEKLEAPVQLTPEQLETVAAGFAKQVSIGKGDPTTTSGAQMPTADLLKLLKLS
jgi:hypothetical protein